MAAVPGVALCDPRVARRLSPTEWEEPSVCSMAGAEPDFLENEMNLRNSFWFTIGSLMQQGCDINPKYVDQSIGRSLARAVICKH